MLEAKGAACIVIESKSEPGLKCKLCLPLTYVNWRLIGVVSWKQNFWKFKINKYYSIDLSYLTDDYVLIGKEQNINKMMFF